MLYSIKNREALENINKLVSLNNQVDELGLQDKLGKQKFQETKKFIWTTYWYY